MKMVWNVYYYSFNERHAEVFNVFKHRSFSEAVDKLLKRKLDRDTFSKELKSEAMYYFWGKCEYEVIVTTWPPRITDNRLDVDTKIDIYDQLKLNWDNFVDYVYGFSEE